VQNAAKGLIPFSTLLALPEENGGINTNQTVGLARRERRYKYESDVLKKRCEKVLGILEKKTRTKCEHCGKLTNIKGLR